jgi:NAD(P)-dependent dehydrogenase (short-subunit alcohol dehydrogenase family)
MGILVTGGTGYIGSHMVVELMAAGRDVFIIDSFCNSKASVLNRIKRIAGRWPGFARSIFGIALPCGTSSPPIVPGSERNAIGAGRRLQGRERASESASAR